MVSGHSVVDLGHDNKPDMGVNHDLEIWSLVNRLKSCRVSGERSNDSIKMNLISLETHLSEPSVSYAAKLYGHHTMAVHNPKNVLHARNFANMVTPYTPMDLITEAYALGTKKAAEINRNVHPDRQISVPLQREMTKSINRVLGTASFRHTTAKQFLGNLAVATQQQGASVSRERMERFGKVSTNAQLDRFKITKVAKKFGATVRDISMFAIGQYDRVRGGKLTHRARAYKPYTSGQPHYIDMGRPT